MLAFAGVGMGMGDGTVSAPPVAATNRMLMGIGTYLLCLAVVLNG